MSNNTENDKKENDWAKREVGALWKKTNSNQSFYSGKVKVGDKEVEIVCFTNKHKSEDKHPDLRIYLSESK